MTVKSALMHISKPVHLHFVLSEDAVPEIERGLALIERPSYDIGIDYYVLTTEEIKARVSRSGAAKSHEEWGMLYHFARSSMSNSLRAVD